MVSDAYTIWVLDGPVGHLAMADSSGYLATTLGPTRYFQRDREMIEAAASGLPRAVLVGHCNDEALATFVRSGGLGDKPVLVTAPTNAWISPSKPANVYIYEDDVLGALSKFGNEVLGRQP